MMNDPDSGLASPGLRQRLNRLWPPGWGRSVQARLAGLSRENAELRQSLGEMAEDRDQFARRLSEATRHLLAAQEGTRRKLAGELHDRTSPNLAAIDINLGMLAGELRRMACPRLLERLEDARGLLRDTTEGIRDVCTDLRPAILDHAGLAAALESAVRQFGERTGIRADFRCTRRSRRLLPENETFLFRIAQEALTNCAKHAAARRVDVRLDNDASPIVLEIVDDGRGFAPAAVGQAGQACGQGILNMCELARLAGGECEIDAAPGRGTRIRVEIP